MNNQFTYLVALLSFSIFLGACKTKKIATQEKQKEIPEVQKEKAFNIKLNDIQTLNFNNTIVSFNFNQQTISSKASIKAIKDSVIQISFIPALGIEMVRAYFKPDSVIILDKINQQCVASGYDSTPVGKLPVGFYDLQGLLFNQVFLAAGDIIATDSVSSFFSIKEYPDGAILKAKKANSDYQYTEFNINSNGQVFRTNLISPTTILSCKYSNFEMADQILFPKELKIMYMQGPSSQMGNISIKNMRFNTDVKINVADISRYTKIENLDQIIPNKQ